MYIFITSSSHIHIIHTDQPHTSHTCTSRASRKGCGAPGLRWAAAAVCPWAAACGAPGRRWAAAAVCVAGAVYSELLEKVAARLVAAAPRRRSLLRASRKGCGAPGRRWAAAAVCVAGAIYSEPLEKVAARLVAAGPRLLFVWQAQYTQSL